MPRTYTANSYRYPNEQMILGLTVLVVLLVIILTATATVCLSFIFVLGILIFGYFISRSHHQALLVKNKPDHPTNRPRLGTAARTSQGTSPG